MAKVLATIAGTALAPGVSRNNRLYSREAIARAVTRAQGQLADGKVLSVLTHHEAGDSSDRIIGRITSMSLDENGAARFTADLADTPHARTIASLVDNTSGRPFLTGMSIRGAWVGKVQQVKGADGPVETASDLEFHGIDPTHKPGVEAAGVDTFAWARDGATETTERVLITESVQEARVTAISEETAPATEAAKAQTPAPAGTVYADPGYLKDKKKRYPLNSPGRVRSAWSFINQADNAAQYSAQQLKRIKGKIRAAMKRIGATVTAEGWVIWPAGAITEAAAEVDEHYDDMASPGGSFCVEASNGPICIRISSYSVDPADLDLILRNACEAADVALRSFDPDMDADIDLPGVGPGSDTDGDAGESAEDEDPGIAEATEDPAPVPAAVTTDSKEPVMATATQEAAGQVAEAQIPVSAGDPGPTGVDTQTNRLNNNDTSRNTEDDVAGNSFEAFLQSMIELVCSQAVADGKMNPAYTQLAAKLAMSQALGMSGPQGAASVALRGAGSVPAPPVSAESAPKEGNVAETESDEQLVERLIRAQLAPAAPIGETREQKIARLVEEGVTKAKAQLTESGQGPSRKGLVTGPGVQETALPGDYSEIPEGWPQKPLDQYSTAEWKTYVEPHVAQSVFGGRGSAQPA